MGLTPGDWVKVIAIAAPLALLALVLLAVLALS